MISRAIALWAVTLPNLVCTIVADPPPGHYAWPKEISVIDDEISEHQVAFSDLPSNAYEREMFSEERETTGALFIDLNGDGVKELIVNDGTGGSGGPGYRILQRSHGNWKVIARFQGGLTLCRKANRYYQLEVVGHGGGGFSGKSLFRFVDGRYREVRGEYYKEGNLLHVLTEKELGSYNDLRGPL